MSSPVVVGPDAFARKRRLSGTSSHNALRGTLTRREQLVLQMRFGLGNGNIYQREQIGQRLGVTRQRVQQIEQAALRKLREAAAAGTAAGLRQYREP